MSKQKLDLTDSEWMSIIDQERDGLPVCCANVSTLRDTIISTARNGGESVFYTNFDTLKQHLGWCFPEHGEMTPVVKKIADQIDWVPEDIADHEKRREL